jgi:hypothetical protein
MAHIHERSLNDARRDAERARAGLTDTVDQLKSAVSETASELRERLSPNHIKAEASDYFRTRGADLYDSVTRMARENPLQAVAIGAGVAYPLMKVVRAIPVPVLMIGLGLFLTSTRTGRTATARATDMASDVADEIGRRAQTAQETMRDTMASAQDFATNQLNAASGVAASGVQAVKGASFAAADALRGAGASASATLMNASAAANDAISANSAALKDRAAAVGASMSDNMADLKSRAGVAADVASSMAGDASFNAAIGAQQAFAAGADALGAARERASDTMARASRSLGEMVQQNPLVVAGIGLAIGALIGASLPTSEVEKSLVGGANGQILKRAKQAAAQGLATVATAAAGVRDDVAKAAEEQGLDSEGLKATADEIGHRVRKVAENATTAAFDLPADKIH